MGPSQPARKEKHLANTRAQSRSSHMPVLKFMPCSKSSRVLRSDVLIDLIIYKGTICKSSDLAPSFFQVQVWDFDLNLCLAHSNSARAQWKHGARYQESFLGSKLSSAPALNPQFWPGFQVYPPCYGSPAHHSLSLLAYFPPICHTKEPLRMPVNRVYKPGNQWVVMHTQTVSACKGMWQGIPSKANVEDQQIQHTPRFPVGLTEAKHFINSEQLWQETFSLSFIPEKRIASLRSHWQPFSLNNLLDSTQAMLLRLVKGGVGKTSPHCSLLSSFL